MKEIKLTRGKITIVDDEDFDYLNQWKWITWNSKKVYYACRTIKVNDKKSNIFMHRIIMKTPNNMQVDHIDHNGLNNQKNNLRNCSRSQNFMNKTASGKSRYLGVHYLKTGSHSYICAAIKYNHNHKHLGLFLQESEAAIAYDISAMIYHKEFANTNFQYSDWFKKHLYSLKSLNLK